MSGPRYFRVFPPGTPAQIQDWAERENVIAVAATADDYEHRGLAEITAVQAEAMELARRARELRAISAVAEEARLLEQRSRALVAVAEIYVTGARHGS